MTLAHRVAVMCDGEIRQLGTPEQIYDDPADTFVAGFIGSPAMNLLPVHAEAGGVRTEDGRFIVLPAPRSGPLTLGARAEDIHLSSLADAHLQARVFGFELLGECTMATVMIGAQLMAVKAPKSLRLQPDEQIGIRFDLARLYWFDTPTGLRLPTPPEPFA